MFNTLPANPFPPSSEQMGAGGGSYVLPVASADTLGGVKVGTGLSINESGVLSNSNATPYSLPTASDETLGGVKVGSNLSIADGVLSAPAPYTPPAYSTSEFDTGKKWIDGRRVYGKVFDFSSAITVAYNSWTNTGEDTEGTSFLNARGLHPAGEGFSLNASADNGKLMLMTNAYSSISIKTVYVEYIKTESEV